MFNEAEAPVSGPEGGRAATLRAEMERAMVALTRAQAALDGAMPDPLTIELAEAINRAAGVIVKVTRQARVARLV